jgi:hypothetical protein
MLKLGVLLQELFHDGITVKEVSFNQVQKDYIKLNKIYNQSVMSDNHFQMVLHFLGRYYQPMTYYAYLDDELVGFLMKAKTTLTKEMKVRLDVAPHQKPLLLDAGLTLHAEGESKVRDACLMIAVDKNHREKGIFNNLITRLEKPYFVHLNSIFSPMDIWKKQGCEIVIEFENSTDYIGICGSHSLHESIVPMFTLK